MSQLLSGKALYAGSFDPITYGHINLIQRAARLFEELVIAVGDNPRKNYLFSASERVEMVERSVENLDSVKVMRFQNLLIYFARKVKAQVIIRGLRASTDFDYEFQIGLVNMDMERDIETLFMLADPRHIFISSSAVKEIAYFGGELKNYVPPFVAKKLKQKMEQLRQTQNGKAKW